MEKPIKEYFSFDLKASLVLLLLAGVYGYLTLGGVGQAFASIFICLLLAILEIFMSFDNATMNAHVLEDLDEKWRRRFLVYGILIAVFGVRLILPDLIISIAGNMTFWEAIKLSFVDHVKYAEILKSAHVIISAFGGSFLMLVTLEFFLDEEKENHWIKIIEEPLNKISKRLGAEILAVTIAISVLIVLAFIAPNKEMGFSILISGIIGIIVRLAVEMLNKFLNNDSANIIVRSGIGTFIYLEILDASFSFDGVIGALVITNQIVFIMIGLGIGALFVRSLTLVMVDKGTLNTYKFMSHGAFYAMASLTIIMFTTMYQEVSEFITVGLSMFFIASSILYSKYYDSSYKNQ